MPVSAELATVTQRAYAAAARTNAAKRATAHMQTCGSKPQHDGPSAVELELVGVCWELGLGVDTGFVNILTLKSVLKLHASTSSLRCHNFLLCLQLPIHASCRFPLLRLDATVPP